MYIYTPPQDPMFEILYADDDILVLNKQSGLLSVPGRLPEHKDSLYKRILSVFPTATVVHRLDTDTSGIIIMPLNRPALSHISRQFQQRTVKKTYIADIYGITENKTGSIDLPLICDWPNRPRQIVCYENGKQSLTHYKVLYSKSNYSRVELSPITGRSHQLRVHMQAIGHPIIGDPLYAHEEALNMADRLHLHAHKLTLRHPSLGTVLNFTSEINF
ncbi:MAG: RNA pseudouridine synthase [Rhizobiales bacterium]|nr:RNA pseudouridine synthase [Hyphomicrobiales bacterium]